MDKAVIDADFFIKMTAYDTGGTLFLQLMKDLDLQPIMHQYVAGIELKKVEIAQTLIEEQKIQVVDYDDYMKEPSSKEDYLDYFLRAYERMNLYDFPKNEDIFTYHAVDESLGEIRSIYMAKMMGYPIFMSDDRLARKLATDIFLPKKPIEAKSVFRALMDGKSRGTSITLKQLNPTITNVFRNRRDLLEQLRGAYADMKCQVP